MLQCRTWSCTSYLSLFLSSFPFPCFHWFFYVFRFMCKDMFLFICLSFFSKGRLCAVQYTHIYIYIFIQEGERTLTACVLSLLWISGTLEMMNFTKRLTFGFTQCDFAQSLQVWSQLVNLKNESLLMIQLVLVPIQMNLVILP